MKYLLALIVILNVISCRPGQVFYCEKFIAGMCVNTAGFDISPLEIEQTVRITEDSITHTYPDFSNLEALLEDNSTYLVFTDKHMAADCAEIEPGIVACDQLVSGLNTNGRVIRVRARPCSEMLILAHELVHSFQIHVLNNKFKPAHPWPLFGERPGEQSVTQRAQENCVDQLESCEAYEL